jgi:two-component system, OmpR family, phosphate regulon sensor histidine kinase PhoR
MPNPWQSEIFRFVLYLFVSVCIGWLIGNLNTALFAGMLAYLARHLINLYRLERWLRRGAGGSRPASNGIWREIYYDLSRLKRQDKRRKKRLGKILNRFRKATAALPDGTVVLGPYDEINWFNSAAARLLGLKNTDIGQHIGNLVRHPKFTNYLVVREYDKGISIPAPRSSDIVIGIRIVRYGKGLRLLIAQDITRVKQMETMRRDFVANVSHELRTPLTVLLGYLENLQEFPEISPDRVNRSINSMVEQAVRMRALIDDLMLLTRLETKIPEVVNQYVDMRDLLARLCNEFSAIQAVPDRIQLQLESPATVLGNETELRSAVSNLISNALKYSPAESPVKVSWIDDDAGGVRLDVVDSGEGIAAEYIPRLTERFYRVDVNRSRQQGGTGLGLAIVKHVVNRHGGDLKIRSEVGKGSCFSFRFPAERVVKSRKDNIINL